MTLSFAPELWKMTLYEHPYWRKSENSSDTLICTLSNSHLRAGVFSDDVWGHQYIQANHLFLQDGRVDLAKVATSVFFLNLRLFEIVRQDARQNTGNNQEQK